MEITKEISVNLSKYDEFGIVEIIYSNNNTYSNICPFLSYSIKNEDFFSLAKMEYDNLTFSTKLNVDKNSDFYFSIIDNKSEEKYHIYLGNSSEECIIVDNLLDKTIEQQISSEQSFEEKANCLPVIVDNEKTYISKKKKRLSFTYKLNKRIKIFLIKLYRLMPNFITGNYRRRINL